MDRYIRIPEWLEGDPESTDRPASRKDDECYWDCPGCGYDRFYMGDPSCPSCGWSG